MEMNLYQVMFIVGNAAWTYIVNRVLELFYEKQSGEKVWSIILYIGYFVVITAAAFAGNPSPLMSGEHMAYYTTDLHMSDTGTLMMHSAEFAGILALTFFYERNVRKNILTAAGVFAGFIGAKAAVFWYVGEANRISALPIEDAALLRLELSVLLIYTVAFTLIGIYNIREGMKKAFLYRLFVLLAPCGIGWFLFRLSVTVIGLSATATDLSSVYSGESMGLLFAACLWLFWLYDFIVRSLSDTYEKILLRKENLYYEKRLKDMEQSTAAWKKLRHDLKNHFIVLKGMLDSGEEDRAKTYLEEFIQNELGNKGEIQTGNTAIDSILNYKMLEAKQYSVTLHLDIQIPEQLSVSSQAMSIILGNAIDNAIEAAEKTKEKCAGLVLHYTKGRLLIQISNPYIGELKTGIDGEYLTGKAEKEKHGYGLKNIRDAVEQSGGVMHIEAKEQHFTVTILLYV